VHSFNWRAPNSVAAHDTRRNVMDGRAKILKKTGQSGTGHYRLARPQTNYECGALDSP